MRLLLVEDGGDGIADLVGTGVAFRGREEVVFQTPVAGEGVFFFCCFGVVLIVVTDINVGSKGTESPSPQNTDLHISLLADGAVLLI